MSKLTETARDDIDGKLVFRDGKWIALLDKPIAPRRRIVRVQSPDGTVTEVRLTDVLEGEGTA